MSDRLTYLKTVLWALVGVLASVSVIRFMYGLGAVTDLSDAAPWGLWIGFDVMSGVALAAGGFVMAAIVHIFGMERYRPFARAAILTALLGYAAVAVGLLYDLGLPWNIWHPAVHWQVHSVLFEVAACVMLYLTVLILEFAPVVLEHPFFDRPFFRTILTGLERASIVLIITGIALSTLHQSSLGSLFLITPDRLHPLWYSHWIYVEYFVSAVALGLATVVLEALFSRYFLGHEVHARELGGLGLGAAVVLVIYLALRLGDLAARGILGTAFDGSWPSNLFLFEIGLAAVVPAALLLIPAVRRSAAGVGLAATLVVLGMVGNRMDTSIVAFARPEGIHYFPTWEEVAVSAGIVAGFMLLFLFFAEHLNVFEDVKGHPEARARRWDPGTARNLMAPGRSLPRRYTLAALGGAAVALPFLPLGGPPVRSVPAGAPRWVEGEVSPGTDATAPTLELARAGLRETRLLLLIDGNRSGELALFDHRAHEDRVGEAGCAACHHLNLPLDEASSCHECHRDMYAPTATFDHELHEAALQEEGGCDECHQGAATKSYDQATACSECHEAGAGDVIDPPRAHWADAVGYMEAMHGLCVTCHQRLVDQHPDEYPADLARCGTCHDPDRREQLRALEPRKRTPPGDRVAETTGRAAPPQTPAPGPEE